ncbi:MAG: transporter [Candidatus Aminicenantes bacterium]|nr:MAG: transporter [Candidatus Aminicenantes bacterium]
MMKMFRMKSVAAGIFIFLLPFIVSAQWFLLQDSPTDKTKLGFRYLRPDFKGDVSLSFLSGVYDLSVSIPTGSRLNIVGVFPFASMGVEGDESESGIGNIYIGLQHRLKSTVEKGISLSLGVFLPTMSEDKLAVCLIGIFTNYYEFQKYMPNVLTIYGNLAYHHIKSEGLMLGLEIGPKLAIPTKNGGDAELYAHYGLSGGYRTGGIAFKAELAGIAVITEEVDDFGDRFIHSLAFGLQWVRGSIRPGIFYKIYLKEEMKDIVSGVLGIKLDVLLK